MHISNLPSISYRWWLRNIAPAGEGKRHHGSGAEEDGAMGCPVSGGIIEWGNGGLRGFNGI